MKSLRSFATVVLLTSSLIGAQASAKGKDAADVATKAEAEEAKKTAKKADAKNEAAAGTARPQVRSTPSGSPAFQSLPPEKKRSTAKDM